MSKRSAIPVVIVAAALAGGCAEDTRPDKSERAADHSGDAAVQKTPITDSAGTGSGREKADAGEKARARHRASGDRHKQAAASKRATAPQRPTAAQIAKAIANQGEHQVDDLPPRLKRLRAIGIARLQGPSQKPRQMSPAEQRAFEIGTQSPKYQD